MSDGQAIIKGKERQGGPRDGQRVVELALPHDDDPSTYFVIVLSASDAKAIAKSLKKMAKWAEGGADPEGAEEIEE